MLDSRRGSSEGRKFRCNALRRKDRYACDRAALRLDVRSIGLFQLHRDIRFHSQHIGYFHRAAQIHDRARTGTAELREMRQDPHRAQPLGDRAAHHPARRKILVEMSAQRVARRAPSAARLHKDGTPFRGERPTPSGSRSNNRKPKVSSRRSIRRAMVEELVRKAVAALRKLSVRATTTKTRKSSHEMRSSRAAPMGCSIFAACPSRKFCHCPGYPSAMLLAGSQILTGNRAKCTSFRMRIVLPAPQ